MKNKYLILTILLMQTTPVLAMDPDDKMLFLREASAEVFTKARFPLPDPEREKTRSWDSHQSVETKRNPMGRHPNSITEIKPVENVPDLNTKVLVGPVYDPNLYDLYLASDNIRLNELVLFAEGKKLYCKSDHKEPIEVIRSYNSTEGLECETFDRFVNAINIEIREHKADTSQCQKEVGRRSTMLFMGTIESGIIRLADIEELSRYTSMIGYTTSNRHDKPSLSPRRNNIREDQVLLDATIKNAEERLQVANVQFLEDENMGVFDSLLAMPPLKVNKKEDCRSSSHDSKEPGKEKAEITKSSAKKVIPSLPQPLNLNHYGDVKTLNKIWQLTYDLISDDKKKPRNALLALFSNTSGEIKGLWETRWRINRAMSEKPGDYGALCNRVKRYDATKQNTVLKFHLDLVKSTAEGLYLLKESNIIDQVTNREIKNNVELFRLHMEKLPFASDHLPRDRQLDACFGDYQKWLGNVGSILLKGNSLIPYLPQPLDLNDYEDVQTLNKLCEYTHDLSSNYPNIPRNALLALFSNTSGEIKGLWETNRRRDRTISEKPGHYAALYNRMKRYKATQHQNTVLKFHLDLVKSIAESLFLLKKNDIIDASTHMGIKHNVELFRQHMENLPHAKSQMQYDLQINTFFGDYVKWFEGIGPKALKAGILVKADPDSIYHGWEMMGQDPENFGN